MARRSRFLKRDFVPSAAGSSYEYNRSCRATSAAPSRDYRERSAAPLRASSLAPSSMTSYRVASGLGGRASSIEPDRYITASSYRASSCTPYRASSVAPVRASSIEPSSRSILRASSVAPYSSTYRMDRSTSLPPKSVSFRSTPLLGRPTMSTPLHIDTSIPTRQFGTRLGIHKMETSVKPAIYDEYYGTTYVPSGGRDSWSAYRISDETLDDNDDLVYESAKKDYEVMKRVNKQVVEALSVPAPMYIPAAPAYKRFTPQQPAKIIRVAVNPELNKSTSYQRAPVRQTPTYHRAPRQQAGTYRRSTAAKSHENRETTPAVKISYSSDNKSSDLLRPKSKSISNETIDFAQPATFGNLKGRLRDARNSMDVSKSSLSKYDTDPELRAISAEVNAIRNAREKRAESLRKLM
ncbi:uncharacterized protein [Watersipora subatra]|uniref:uncharacterized protein isoform X2 n=1 Tax=Watersipora subatra TaxID=2589382 RepID=UPI00355BA7D2